MLCGCIDIGTNTTRVLVAEARPAACAEVLQRRAFTRLGRGLAPGGTIPAARIAETAGVVAEQHALAEQAGASTIRAVATAVIRRAANRDEFCDADPRPRRRRGLRARRRGGGAAGLPGRDAHARPAAAGARRGRRRRRRLDRDRRRDAGRRRRVVGLVRVRLGLPGRRLPGRRPAGRPTSCARCGCTPRARWPASIPARSTPRSRSAAARRRCGGWWATSSTTQSLARALRVLTSGPATDVAARFDLDAQRVRLMPAGLLALDAAAQALGQPLQIGCGGLREGVLLDLAAVTTRSRSS